MDLSKMKIIEAGHVTEVYGPVQALRNYLIPRCEEYTLVTHPFSYTKMEGTETVTYAKGKVTENTKGHRRGKNQLIQWLKDFLFNLKFLAGRKHKAGLFVGVDNLNALTGIIMKFFGKTDKVAYYVIDHMDRRFPNPIFNFFYEFIDGLACAGSDYIWCLSERMARAKEKKFMFSRKKSMIVPVGIELDKVDKYHKEEKLVKKSMVVMSMLDKTKGVQLLIEAMPDILKKVPEAELIIIGTGPYETELRAQASALGLMDKSIKFTGVMNHEELFRFIPHERVGLAPYMDDPNNYTYYADPTKPKEYLGCGLPIVTTDVPWIAEEVRKRPMGVVCKYRKEEIAEACIKLLTDDDFYLECLKNAVEFASGFRWDEIYTKAFSEMK